MYTIDDIEISWLGHATVKIAGPRTIYIDPFGKTMTGEEEEADVIITTHSHFDHFDPDVIAEISEEETVVVAKEGCEVKKLKNSSLVINPGDEIEVKDVKIKAVPAHNRHRFRAPDEPYHPKGEGMGVIIEMEGKKFYHAGDTDYLNEMKGLKMEKLDVAFLPIGGTYTMDAEEAVKAVKSIRPKVVIPIHYNLIDGTEADPESFKESVENVTSSKAVVLEED